MSKIILGLSIVALMVGASEASAHLRKVHHQKLYFASNAQRLHHQNQQISYSVPQWGPFSGYEYYDDGYPTYLSNARPYLSGKATYEPVSNNYADLTFGCCGSPQDTVVTGATPSRSGFGASGPFGWNGTGD